MSTESINYSNAFAALERGFVVTDDKNNQLSIKDGALYVNGVAVPKDTTANFFKATVILSVLENGLQAAAAQDNILKDHMNKMQEQTDTLEKINTLLSNTTTIVSSFTSSNNMSSLSADAAKFRDLLKEPTPILTVSNDLKDKLINGKNLTVDEMHQVQTALSSAQSSQGALNEEMSLTVNKVASERSAIFTQLQSLLQTLTQLLQTLSRM